jgi:hypothetical protein
MLQQKKVFQIKYNTKGQTERFMSFFKGNDQDDKLNSNITSASCDKDNIITLSS